MIFLILLEIRNFFLKFNAILGSAYLVCSFDPGAQFSMSFLLTFAALLGFSLAQFYEGYKYLFASSIYASILSSFVLFIYGFNPNGSSIIFNLIFSVPFSVISTLGGILAIGEFFFLGTDTLWFLVCCLTFALVWGLGVLSPLLNIEFIYVIPIGILALVSLNYQYWNLALLRKLFRRQKCKFHA
ncbi:MAG: hypothetical protein NZO16_03125 [Deltaproteobacteria bacterium]|nr:hypothetical protein [Deltaproteobacteria bacterium]